MDKKQVFAGLLLALTAFIWGSAFVAQSLGMNYVGPFTFNAVRSLIGGAFLLPVIYLMDRQKGKENIRGRMTSSEKSVLLKGGICCGLVLTVSSSLQQVGIRYTTVGKAGFITALYIVIVPLLGIFLKKRVRTAVWAGVVLATVGLYLITMTEDLSIRKGDFYVLLCAFFFSIHILVIDYFSPLTDGVRLSCIQLFICGILSGIPMLLTERPQISAVIASGIPILYAGLLSSGIAYTLQIVAQKHINPVIASLICSLESVFAVICGWIFLRQTLSVKELIGCIVVFAAIILAQLPERKKAGFKNER